MDRAEAIRVLEAKGLYAKQRTWNLGDTIFVGALPDEHSDLKLFKVGLYLYPDPNDDAVWWVTGFEVPGTDTKCGSLEAAVELGADRLLSEARRWA